MKYYFITYQAENHQGSKLMWNRVINESPMKFIKRIAFIDSDYNDFVVINTCEISEEEFNEYNNFF